MRGFRSSILFCIFVQIVLVVSKKFPFIADVNYIWRVSVGDEQFLIVSHCINYVTTIAAASPHDNQFHYIFTMPTNGNCSIFDHTPPDWIPQDMLDMVANDKARCMAEHGTTEALIDEVNAGSLPNDRTLTCYMFCLFDSFSLVDEDGNVDADLIVSILPENLQSVAAEVFGECGSVPGSDVCDKMYNIGKCAQAKRPDLWFMI